MRESSAEVVVIGAGPAGSTVSALLKSYLPGARIVVVERERFPRHHVGESTLPDTNRVLAKLGVLAKIEACGFPRKVGASIKWRAGAPHFSEQFGRGVLADGLPAHSWQVERSRYDEVLLEHASGRGVEVLQPASVTRPILEGDRVVGVEIQTEDGPAAIRAKFVVDCSGQARLLGRALGVQPRGFDLGDLAIHRYFRGPDIWVPEIVGTFDAGHIFFAATPAGWVWYIPIGHDLVSVGVVTKEEFVTGRDVADVFATEVATVPELERPLATATLVSGPADARGRTIYTVQNWSYTHDVVTGPGWYAAGDSAAFVDPVLSSGVMLAHHAGHAVANAIHTELTRPEVDPVALRRSYEEFHRDLREGFLVMAEWWYHHRDTGIEDWWRRANVLSRRKRASASLTDLASFLHFIGGYLSDFRFAHIGTGYGRDGLALYVEGFTGQRMEVAAQAHEPPPGALERAFEAVRLDWYYGTYVETDLWWRLPVLFFTVGDREIAYRPPPRWSAQGEPDADAMVTVLQGVLDAVEDRKTVREAVSTIASEVTEAERAIPASVILDDLVGLGVVRFGEPASAPAPRVDVPGTSLARRRFDSVELVWTERAQLRGTPARREAVVVLRGGAADGVQYRPPRRVRVGVPLDVETWARAVRAVLEVCDGRRSIEDAKRYAVRQLGGLDDRTARDVAHVVAMDLIAVGALSAS